MTIDRDSKIWMREWERSWDERLHYCPHASPEEAQHPRVFTDYEACLVAVDKRCLELRERGFHGIPVRIDWELPGEAEKCARWRGLMSFIERCKLWLVGKPAARK